MLFTNFKNLVFLNEFINISQWQIVNVLRESVVLIKIHKNKSFNYKQRKINICKLTIYIILHYTKYVLSISNPVVYLRITLPVAKRFPGNSRVLSNVFAKNNFTNQQLPAANPQIKTQAPKEPSLIVSADCTQPRYGTYLRSVCNLPTDLPSKQATTKFIHAYISFYPCKTSSDQLCEI